MTVAPQPTRLLRIPEDLAATPGSKLLEVGELCFGEYHQTIRQKPRNVFVAEHMLIFVVKGAKVFRFPDREFVVEAGKALFLKRGCYLLCESIEQDRSYESISLFFNESVLRDFWHEREVSLSHHGSKADEGEALQMVVLTPSPELQSFRDRVILGLAGDEKLDEKEMMHSLKELLRLLLESSDGSDLMRFFDELYDEYLPDPVFVVSRNLLAPLTLSDYAKLCCRSLSKFKRDFRAKAGESPGKWIVSKRLEQAGLLLGSTNLSVGEVCARSGFNNLSHFIRTYKAAFGVTPGRRV